MVHDNDSSDSNDNDSNTIPLPLLFSKPQRDQLRISPCGKYLAWRERTTTTTTANAVKSNNNKNTGGGGGVLNLWIQRRSPKLQPPKQITFETERDVCVLYRFTNDDKTILYLRETKNGSELYHLYAIDIMDDDDDDGHHNDDEISKKNIPKPRDIISDPKMTCAMGFVGPVHLWSIPNKPRHILTSTSRGAGKLSLFWDVSLINVDTGELEVIMKNDLSTWIGLFRFILLTLCTVLVKFLTCGIWKVNPPQATVMWFTDREGNIRGRIRVSLTDLTSSFSVRSSSSAEWKTIHCVPWEELNMTLVGSVGGTGLARMDFTPDGRYVDVHVCHVSDEKDTTSYERYDICTGQRVKTLAHNTMSDITGFVCHPKTKDVQIVMYEYEKPTMECLTMVGEDETGNDGKDDDDETLLLSLELKSLSNAFPNMSLSIVNRTLDDDVWILYVEGDVGHESCGGSPCGYFIYERCHINNSSVEKLSSLSLKPQPVPTEMNAQSQQQQEPSLYMFCSPRPDLANYKLGPMAPVHIKARDGEDLLCYLSTPPPKKNGGDGSSSTKGTPLVLVIHGGPQTRDYWHHEPLCQLLCNRGMSVLRVNYRGSTGFGTRFLRKGLNGTFATGVQDDIEDAALHAIQQGWTARDKIAIFGGSFGGYCALHPMTFKPDLFCCAVAICPVTVVGAANESGSFYGSPLVAQYFRKLYGDEIYTNAVAARAVSPMHHVSNITRPVMLVHGEDDPRVHRRHSDRVAGELQRLGKEKGNQHLSGCEYYTFADEGHGVRKEKNILYMYSKVEQFLCGQLDLSVQPDLEDYWTKGHSATIHNMG